MLTFIKNVIGADLAKPVAAWQQQDIRHFLVHTADCYLYWLLYMALEETVDWPNEAEFNDIDAIVALYEKADAAMERCLSKFGSDVNLQIDNNRTREDKLSASLLMIFTHVITHEFHHKGQIMSMCRQLGYDPAGTDIYQFFYK